MPKLRLCVILVVGISLLLFFPGLVFVILQTYHIQCGKWIILKGKNIGISLDVGLQHESKGMSPNESYGSFEYSKHQLERTNSDHRGRKIKQSGKNPSSKQNLGSNDQYDDILEIFEKATNAMPSSTIVMEKEGILMTVFDYSAQNNQKIPYTRVVHRLLQSVRLHNPGVRVALATNNKNQNWDAFDIVFTPAEWQNNTTEISSKIAGLKNSPFERTIFLDSETVVMGSLLPLFEFLRWYDLAMAPQNNWKGNWYLEQVLCGGSTASLEVQYNTGVFAYRQSPSTRKFFDIWNTIHHNSPCNRKVLSNGKQRGAFDQCSLHHAIRKTDGLKVATLDADIWNDRRIIPHSEPTRVAHPHCTDTRGTGCDDFWKHPDYAHKPQAPIQTTYSEEYCRKI